MKGITGTTRVGAVGPLLRLPDVGTSALVTAAFGARLALVFGGTVAFIDPGQRAVGGATVGVDAVHLAELVALAATLGALQQLQSSKQLKAKAHFQSNQSSSLAVYKISQQYFSSSPVPTTSTR